MTDGYWGGREAHHEPKLINSEQLPILGQPSVGGADEENDGYGEEHCAKG